MIPLHPGSSPSRHLPIAAVVVTLASVGLLLLLLLLLHILLQRSLDYIEFQPNLKHTLTFEFIHHDNQNKNAGQEEAQALVSTDGRFAAGARRRQSYRLSR